MYVSYISDQVLNTCNSAIVNTMLTVFLDPTSTSQWRTSASLT